MMGNEFWSSNSMFDQKALQNIECILKTLPLLFPFSYFLLFPKLLLTSLLFAAPREAAQSLRFWEALYALHKIQLSSQFTLLIGFFHCFHSKSIHWLWMSSTERLSPTQIIHSHSLHHTDGSKISSLIFSLNSSPMCSVLKWTL